MIFAHVGLPMTILISTKKLVEPLSSRIAKCWAGRIQTSRSFYLKITYSDFSFRKVCQMKPKIPYLLGFLGQAENIDGLSVNLKHDRRDENFP